VRNRHGSLLVCVAFIGLSAVSLSAQSDRTSVLLPRDGSQAAQPEQALMAASLTDASASAGLSKELPDAPSASQPDTSTEGPSPAAQPIKRSSQGAPAAAAGGAFEVDRGVADRKFWVLSSSMFAASIANAELTQRCQKLGTCSFVPVPLRSRAAMYGIGIPADLGIMYLTYHMKKKHSPIWYVPSALVTAANVYVGIHAFHRTQQ